MAITIFLGILAVGFFITTIISTCERRKKKEQTERFASRIESLTDGYYLFLKKIEKKVFTPGMCRFSVSDDRETAILEEIEHIKDMLEEERKKYARSGVELQNLKDKHRNEMKEIANYVTKWNCHGETTKEKIERGIKELKESRKNVEENLQNMTDKYENAMKELYVSKRSIEESEKGGYYVELDPDDIRSQTEYIIINDMKQMPNNYTNVPLGHNCNTFVLT